MLSVFIHASAYDFEVDGIYYNITDQSAKTVEVTCYAKYKSNYVGDIVIPDSVNYNDVQYSVTSIEDWAFCGCSGLTSLTIPYSVTSIGKYAFDLSDLGKIAYPDHIDHINSFNINYKRTFISIKYPQNSIIEDNGVIYDLNKTKIFFAPVNLTNITIPNSVTSIGHGAFSFCSGLTSINIPNSVTSIGKSTFYDCSGLTSINIPNSVTSIGESAFSGCSGLTSINIPNSVTSIGEYAFYFCSGLTSINIPNSVTSIGEYAFSGCSNVKKAIWLGDTPPSGASDFAEINYVSNNQFNFKNQTVYPHLSSCFEVNNVVYVPVSITEKTCDIIDNNYDSKTDIIIDKTVNNSGILFTVLNINDYAFYCNNSITSADIKHNGNIGFQAFYNCDALTSVTASNNGDISKEAFSRCYSLNSISLNNIGDIGNSAFEYCNNLKTVLINNTGIIEGGAFKGCSLSNSLTIGNKVTSIGSTAFNNSKLREVVIPDNIKMLGMGAFANCDSLKSVTIGKGITELSSVTFEYCKSLESITIPSNIGRIGDWAFYGCSNLHSVECGDGVTTIEEKAFFDCSSLTRFTSMAIEPPTCKGQVFSGINQHECILYVPEESIEKYKVADQWKDFFNIESGIDDITADGVNELDFSKSASGITLNNAADARVEVYGLDGRLCRAIPAYAGEEIALNRGVYIVRVNGKSLKIAI